MAIDEDIYTAVSHSCAPDRHGSGAKILGCGRRGSAPSEI